MLQYFTFENQKIKSLVAKRYQTNCMHIKLIINEPYAFQVAGHSRENSHKFEILKDQARALIYKSFQDCSRGMREVIFYERVFSPDASEAFKLLRQFIPMYHGIFQCPSTKAYYVGLSDLVASFKQPNVCDFKMGTITYLPGSSEDKISREKFKYAWRRKLGFLLSGMQVYDPRTHCMIKLPKAFGRNLNPEQVYSVGLKTFLGPDPVYRVELAHKYLIQLSRILHWYKEYGAERLTFCRSSLLFIHESVASGCEESPPSNNNTTNTTTANTTTTTNGLRVVSTKLIEKSNRINNSQLLIPSTTNATPINVAKSNCINGSNTRAQVYLIDFAHWEEKIPHSSMSAAVATTSPPRLTSKTHINDNNAAEDGEEADDSSYYITYELTEGFRYGLETLISLMQRVVNNGEN
uniref:Kinase n=1 Tax=Trichobilharzia regenti TaxID=157069 RepID=A0AA85IV88_TRIRE|nr:unnamed protein product [Trichobilharzia regenti]